MSKVFMLKDGKWEEAKPIEFNYPWWIRMIPIRSVRSIFEDLYWKYGGEL